MTIHQQRSFSLFVVTCPPVTAFSISTCVHTKLYHQADNQDKTHSNYLIPTRFVIICLGGLKVLIIIGRIGRVERVRVNCGIQAKMTDFNTLAILRGHQGW